MARKAPQVVVALTAEAVVTKLRGKYSAGVTYKPGEWVIESEAIWACNVEVKGVAPAEGVPQWSLIGSLE